MKNVILRSLFVTILILFLSSFLAQKASASPLTDLITYYQNMYTYPLPVVSILDSTVVSKAQPDECYNGIGNPYPPGPPCAEGQPKANHAYVWGLAQAGDFLWFGTMTNTHCLILGNIAGMIGLGGIETDAYVCEGSESAYDPFLAANGLGDWRPPKIFTYDMTTKQTVEKTVPNPVVPLIEFTLGLRYASSLDDVVLLGGPNLPGDGINLFAFRAGDGSFIGATALSGYNDIRKAVVHNGVLYIGVQNTAGGGSVLRWKGNSANPFQFEVVGNLDLNAAYITLHDGKLFVTTWPVLPNISAPVPIFTGLMNLWMSPTIPAGGLTAADAGNWTKVWQVDQYEPDAWVRQFYLGGDLYSFGGYLYWGTMHVPFIAALSAMQALDISGADGVFDVADFITTALGTHRAISVFRGKDFGTGSQTIELLYGNRFLPVYDASQKSYTIASDSTHRNLMNAFPKWGPSGIDNFFNTYVWAMEGFNDSLYLGTFDWSYFLTYGLIDMLTPSIPAAAGPDAPSLGEVYRGIMPRVTPGADLYYFSGNFRGAYPESRNGVGNYSSYGIRNMLTSGSSLFLGMANPMNLLTDPSDLKPEGGWELIEMKKHDPFIRKLPDPYPWPLPLPRF